MENEWPPANVPAKNSDEGGAPLDNKKPSDRRGFREANKARCPQCNSSWIKPGKTDDGQDALWCQGHNGYIHCPNCKSLCMEEVYITEQERKALLCKDCNTAWAGK